ncbi:DUF3667 domain-containing protein [Sandarakinorhabdus rubra]|uniref:DUF3667 domain-containing protein n=1 Tax=Sandarakinorhabdus rubra TaxID=2672568 RepID=UPI0013DC8547|nr:DUF3667 domain-containing protein [Sandarakinorhabdus rubra]
MLHDIVHGITHLDGKAWITLPMLLFRPGRLTRSYIDGHRARYIAPVPLFLMVVFLMFFVLSFVHVPDGAIQLGDNAATAQRAAEARKALANIDADLAAAKAAGDQTKVKELTAARAGIGVMLRNAGNPEASVADVASDIAGGLARAIEAGEASGSGVPWLSQKVRAALVNPSLLLFKVQTKAYKLSFLLVPLSLPWLWLAFFWRRDVGLYDHAIFALYSLSFMSLVFIAASLLLTTGVTNGLLWAVLVLSPAVHLVAQLRGAYGLGWWGAGWRTIYLSVAALVTLVLYLVLLLILGLLD